MSVKIMGEVWECDLAHSETFVLLAMADHADHDGNHIYPSIGLIRWKTGYSERQVQRIVKTLRDKGVLVVTQDSRAQRATEYRIDLTTVPRKTPLRGASVTPVKMSPVTLVTENGCHGDTGGVTPVSPEPSLNRKREPSVPPYPPRGARRRSTIAPRPYADQAILKESRSFFPHAN